MDYKPFIADVTKWIELLGIAVLAVSLIAAFARAIMVLARGQGTTRAYNGLRRILGRGILLGLEILVAADLIRTVAVDPTLDNVIALGVIVLIRTFLSFSLEIELEGELPWRRGPGRSDEAA